MNKSKNTTAMRALASELVAKEPVVNLMSFDLSGLGMARVTCSVTHTGDSREDHSLVTKELRKRLGGHLEAVAGSFSSIRSGNYQEQITGIVSVVREALPATKEHLKGFKSVSSNMFMDDEENMWVLRKSAAGDLVVKTTGIDDDMSLLKILNQACSGAASLSSVSEFRQMVATASAVGNAAKGGDFVSYVNHNNVIACGYLVATATDEANPEQVQAVVLPAGAVGEGEEEIINVKAITEIHDQEQFPEVQITEQEAVDTVVASARGAVDINTLLDYYKRIYARGPAFYAEFAKRIRAHAFA